MPALQSVTKVYKRGSETVHALRDVTLNIGQGEFVAVVGPSGSGKSTLMNIMGLLDMPTGGTVRVGGTLVTALKGDEVTRLRRQAIGFIFQQFLLIPTMTALQNVMLPLYFAGAAGAKKRATDLLSRVGLASRLHHLPSQMSGGEMQRTAIARALANDPAILLADEPTGNLDSATADSINQLFREINEQGTTVIMVTHNGELAASVPRIISIRDGRIENDEKK